MAWTTASLQHNLHKTTSSVAAFVNGPSTQNPQWSKISCQWCCSMNHMTDASWDFSHCILCCVSWVNQFLFMLHHACNFCNAFLVKQKHDHVHWSMHLTWCIFLFWNASDAESWDHLLWQQKMDASVVWGVNQHFVNNKVPNTLVCHWLARAHFVFPNTLHWHVDMSPTSKHEKINANQTSNHHPTAWKIWKRKTANLMFFVANAPSFHWTFSALICSGVLHCHSGLPICLKTTRGIF